MINDRYAEVKELSVGDITQKIKNSEECERLKEFSSDGKIRIWCLPDNIFVVPSFSQPSHDSPVEYIHIKNHVCPLASCKEKKSKLHQLAKKTAPLCIHTLLTYVIDQDPSTQGASSSSVPSLSSTPTLASSKQTVTSSSKKIKNPKINRDLTTQVVIDNIVKNFPAMSHIDSSEFLRESRKYVEKLVNTNELQNVLHESSRKFCSSCIDSTLEIWSFQSKQAFFLSMGHMACIDIPVKFCRKCKRVFYPELYSKGVFPIHNRFLITLDFLLEFKNLLVMGSSTIEVIKQKILLLSSCEGISEHFESNLINHCKNIEMACIGITALLVTPEDMDNVLCLVCGSCPKIINTDGNAKDSLPRSDNMVYDDKDTSDPPDLEFFKLKLVQECLRKSFFQNEPPKTYNMLKLPLIIAPKVLGKQVNTDTKESIVSPSRS